MNRTERRVLLRLFLDILRFDRPAGHDSAKALDDGGWRALLEISDRMNLTLELGRHASAEWPVWVRERLARNVAGAKLRMNRVRDASFQIDREFRRRGIDYVCLKGLAHASLFSPDRDERMQFDLDLLCRPESIAHATEALEGLGYTSIRELEGLSSDHRAPMIRERDYEWTGDYYDPAIPVAVELHFRFWTEEAGGIPAPGVDAMWDRRLRQDEAADGLTVLDLIDEFNYRCIHALRHLLHGNLRGLHVYELAWFLHREAEECDATGASVFDADWAVRTPERVRIYCTIMASLGQRWFGGLVPAWICDEIADLSPMAGDWLDRFAFSPIDSLAARNKSELWLLLALSERPARALLSRLVPTRVPAIAESSYVPPSRLTPLRRLGQIVRHSAYVGRRAARHIRVLVPTAAAGLAWGWRTAGFSHSFLRFLGTSGLFTFGMFLFVLIYNLYLLELGFRENLLGSVASAFTVGSVAGALPSGWLLNRLGPETALRLCFAGSAVMVFTRSTVLGPVMLIGSAFGAGLFSSLWMVTFAPVVAALAPERSRAAGFSLFLGASIGLGILGGVVGGRLPGWLATTEWLEGRAPAMRATLLAGGAFMLLAALLISRVRLGKPQAASGPDSGQKIYPRGAFIRRYLVVFAVWNLATGAFNPFFNAYLARLGATTAEVGAAFSGGQAAQLAAMGLAPFVYRRFGLVTGIAMMMAFCGIALGGLALGRTVLAGAIAYCFYIALHWMSEPGMFTLLMNRVTPEQRSGASSINFFVVALAQALAAVAAGAALASFGYPAVLVVAGFAAITAGLLLRRLLSCNDVRD